MGGRGWSDGATEAATGYVGPCPQGSDHDTEHLRRRFRWKPPNTVRGCNLTGNVPVHADPIPVPPLP